MNVSVVTPCRNAAAYLPAALASVAAQTRPPDEVLLIDDGSGDDSVAVARRSAAECGLRLRVFRGAWGNAGAARNVGLRHARGDWVALLDADDLWEPDHLEQAERVLSNTAGGGSATAGDVAYMANHRWLRGDAVEPLPENQRPKFADDAAGLPHAVFPKLMAAGFHFGHSTVLYRADRVRAVGGFDASQVRRHDLDLWLRVVADHTWAWGAEPAARYRVDTPGSISKAVVEAEYFQLRALLRNREPFDGPATDALLAATARKAMSLALADGTAGDLARVRPLAWPHLSGSFRLAYRAADLCGPAVRAAVRLKRRAYWATAGRCEPDAPAARTSSPLAPRDRRAA